MSVSMTFNRNASGGGLSVGQLTTVTGEQSVVVETTVADSVTDQLLNISLDVSLVKGIYIHSTVALTIETNAVDATGGNTIVLVANEPYLWTGSTDLNSNLFTLDVTKMYLTNASGSSATVKMIFVQDSTP